MRMDVFHNAVAVNLMDPVNVTADKAADRAVDMTGFVGLIVIATVGATGDTVDGSNYIAHKAEECDTEDGSYTAVPRGNIFSEIASGSAGEISLFDNATHSCDTAVHAVIYPTKRFVKIRSDVTGTHTNGTPQAIVGLKFGATYLPVNT